VVSGTTFLSIFWVLELLVWGRDERREGQMFLFACVRYGLLGWLAATLYLIFYGFTKDSDDTNMLLDKQLMPKKLL
jgi:hypothetical protein